MNKKYKIALCIIGVLLLLCLGLLIYKKIYYENKGENAPTVYSSIIDKIEGYEYTLDDRDTEIFKEKYYELKEILQQEEIDYEQYAEKIAELFAIDLLTISNKVNKYDVGGLEYLYDSERDMYKSKVMDTLYDYVEDNSYGNRKQKLPTVTNVTIDEVEETEYIVGKQTLDSYEFHLILDYKEDLEYDSDITITTVIDKNKVYIVKYTAN